MTIQPPRADTALSFITNFSQQRENLANSPAIYAASAPNGADKVTISQAAYDRSKEETKSIDTYNFANMKPNQLMDIAQDLNDSGKIDNQQHLMLLSIGLTFGRMGENGQHIQPTEEEIATKLNTPINYIQNIKDRISFLESTGRTADSQSGYEGWKSLLKTLQGMTSVNVAQVSMH